MVHVSYGGEEVEHFGQYDLRPYDPELMEWVWSQDGRVPEGKLGVVGGIEDGKVLYHAIAKVPTFWPWDESVWVPGKAAEYLNGANIAFGGKEHWTADCKIL